MMEAQITPILRIRFEGEIRIFKKMNKILSVQPTTRKPRQGLFEPGSITFTKANLEWVQHPLKDPVVIQLQVHGYNV